MNPPRATLHAALTTLLNEAQVAAIADMHGAPAIPSELKKLAARVKSNILTQVALGRWAQLGIVDPDGLVDLGVEAVLGRVWLGEPPIKIEYDWKRTCRPDIVSWAVRGS